MCVIVDMNTRDRRDTQSLLIDRLTGEEIETIWSVLDKEGDWDAQRIDLLRWFEVVLND